MYQQFNEQFAAATRQFADTAAQINRIALENVETVFGLQMAAIGNRASATFSFLGEAAGARDLDSLKTLWPKGVQVARENLEAAVTTGQDVIGRGLKAQTQIGEIAKAQLESVARKTQESVQNAGAQFKAAADNAAAKGDNKPNGQK